MMVRIRFLPEEKVVDVEQGTMILEAARRASMLIESPCNGTGTCGKCAVRLRNPLPGAIKESLPSHPSRGAGTGVYYRACQTEVYDDLTVETSDSNGHGQIDVLREGDSLPLSLDPFITKEFLEKEQQTRVYAGETVMMVEEGDSRNRSFGLVVDIGTTTLVAGLVDLGTGEEISSVAALNPQSLRAQDVLSRIKSASTDEGLGLMHTAFSTELNGMIGEMTARTGTKKENIYEVVYSGNTCMLHLACAIDPAGLGRYPYKPAIDGDCHLSALNAGLSVAPHALIYLPPIISGFVGADITSGIVATGFHDRKETTLFIDIGTNGEMVLCHGGELWATSAAAGPAFEGMNIACGMRAGVGAIREVAVEPSGDILVKTVEGREARGICGSGLLDAISVLIRHGMVTREGRLLQSGEGNGGSPLASRLAEKNGSRVFLLTDSVYVSQKDVRQVQLAKGAMRTGIEFLLKHAGVEAWQVDSVLVAGAFGYHSRVQSLVDIGLLPESLLEKIRLVGNTSKSGGMAYLLDRESRGRMRSVAKRTKVIELADCIGFDRAFVRSLAFDKRRPGARRCTDP